MRDRNKIVITSWEINCLADIVTRAKSLFPERDAMDIRMDLLAAHTNCPLKLKELRDADNLNFMHDIAGINRHLNRQTFQLEDCFRPRYAA